MPSCYKFNQSSRIKKFVRYYGQLDCDFEEIGGAAVNLPFIIKGLENIEVATNFKFLIGSTRGKLELCIHDTIGGRVSFQDSQGSYASINISSEGHDNLNLDNHIILEGDALKSVKSIDIKGPSTIISLSAELKNLDIVMGDHIGQLETLNINEQVVTNIKFLSSEIGSVQPLHVTALSFGSRIELTANSLAPGNIFFYSPLLFDSLLSAVRQPSIIGENNILALKWEAVKSNVVNRIDATALNMIEITSAVSGGIFDLIDVFIDPSAINAIVLREQPTGGMPSSIVNINDGSSIYLGGVENDSGAPFVQIGDIQYSLALGARTLNLFITGEAAISVSSTLYNIKIDNAEILNLSLEEGVNIETGLKIINNNDTLKKITLSGGSSNNLATYMMILSDAGSVVEEVNASESLGRVNIVIPNLSLFSKFIGSNTKQNIITSYDEETTVSGMVEIEMGMDNDIFHSLPMSGGVFEVILPDDNAIDRVEYSSVNNFLIKIAGSFSQGASGDVVALSNIRGLGGLLNSKLFNTNDIEVEIGDVVLFFDITFPADPVSINISELENVNFLRITHPITPEMLDNIFFCITSQCSGPQSNAIIPVIYPNLSDNNKIYLNLLQYNAGSSSVSNSRNILIFSSIVENSSGNGSIMDFHVNNFAFIQHGIANFQTGVEGGVLNIPAGLNISSVPSSLVQGVPMVKYGGEADNPVSATQIPIILDMQSFSTIPLNTEANIIRFTGGALSGVLSDFAGLKMAAATINSGALIPVLYYSSLECAVVLSVVGYNIDGNVDPDFVSIFTIFHGLGINELANFTEDNFDFTHTVIGS